MALPILVSILSAAWLFLIYAGLGYGLLRALRVTFPSRLMRVLSGFSLGFCVTGNVIMALCFLQKASSPGIIAAVSIVTAAGLIFCKRVIVDCIALAHSALGVGRSAYRPAVILLILLLGGYAIRSLLPPTGFDELMYHLSTVKLYLRHGGFFNIFFNAQSDYPMLTQMHFMIGLALNNDIVCKTLSFLLGCMMLAVIAYLCRYYCQRDSLIVPALLVFCTFTGIIANMSNCDVDIPQALWTVLALAVLDIYFEDPETGTLPAAAVLGGMAVQTKIFGVFSVPLMLAMLMLRRKKALFCVSGLKEAAILAGVPFLMGLPWYIKSYDYNGTILSIGHAAIAGQGLAEPMGIACRTGLWYWVVNTIVRAAAAPWTFSVFPGQHQGDTFGPLFVAILPFLIFVAVSRRVKTLLVAGGLYLALVLGMEMWFIQGGSSIRYSMFVLAIGAPCIVWTVGELGGYPKAQKALRFIVLCAVCLGALIFFKRYHREWRAFFLLHSRERYYRSVLPEYAVITAVNRLPKGAVVMPLYNYSEYLLDVPYITAYRRYDSLEDMKRDFKDKNIGYLFANDKLDVSKNRDAFPEIAEKEVVDSTNGFYLFRIRDAFFRNGGMP